MLLAILFVDGFFAPRRFRPHVAAQPGLGRSPERRRGSRSLNSSSAVPDGPALGLNKYYFWATTGTVFPVRQADETSSSSVKSAGRMRRPLQAYRMVVSFARMSHTMAARYRGGAYAVTLPSLSMSFYQIEIRRMGEFRRISGQG